jgi:hypothetical protein
MPATAELFARYPNDWFIETGTFRGRGVRAALEAGFRNVVSIELSEQLYADAVRNFADQPNVRIVHGDSGKVMAGVIAGIDAPITFWLDGHYSEGVTARGDSNAPLLQELDAIARHPVNTHTVLIDDVRFLGTPVLDNIGRQTVIDRLLTINPAYEIRYEDGHVPGDILVALPPASRR